MGRYIVGITGASGSVYAKRLLEMLLADGHEVLATVTNAGRLVMQQELGLDLPAEGEAETGRILANACGGGKLRYYSIDQIGAPIASGSVCADAMIVVPCTMASVSAMATGASRNLLERAADVMLKERRKLVVVPRELPFNTIHLQNMLALSQCGVVIAPAAPAFYQNPRTLEELVENFADRLMVLLGARGQVGKPWEGI